ncbi:helix-turn-helix domain-containing protein [Leuconostoc citreum]|uniref:helix-turn-helix domain-containing protein n=1 Tax=Leuconostoc citreum TaxID=33964 RepID=UPI0032DFAE3E
MNRLRELRRKQNYSFSTLSEQIKSKTRCDVSPQTLMRFEKHSSDIRLTKLISIADYYNVSIDYLVGRSDER